MRRGAAGDGCVWEGRAVDWDRTRTEGSPPTSVRGAGPPGGAESHRPARAWGRWSWWSPMLRLRDHPSLVRPPAVAQLLVGSEGGESDLRPASWLQSAGCGAKPPGLDPALVLCQLCS